MRRERAFLTLFVVKMQTFALTEGCYRNTISLNDIVCEVSHMPRQPLENLTESMFYVLMALTRGDACGAEITAFAAQVSGGAVRLGPATLYTLLARFEAEGFLRETGTVGCKRYYRLTAAGKAAYDGERARLQRCLDDAARAAITAPASLTKGADHDENERETDRAPSGALPAL